LGRIFLPFICIAAISGAAAGAQGPRALAIAAGTDMRPAGQHRCSSSELNTDLRCLATANNGHNRVQALDAQAQGAKTSTHGSSAIADTVDSERATEETVPLEVVVNAIPHGTYFLDVRLEDARIDDVRVQRDQLVDWGARPNSLEDEIGEAETIWLSELAPDVRFVSPPDEAVLRIRIAPRLLPPNHLSLRRDREYLEPQAKNSLIANYGITLRGTDDGERPSFLLPFGLSGRTGVVAWDNTLSLSRSSDGSTQWQRLASTAFVDDVNRKRRISFGDVALFSGRLGGGTQFAGVTVQSLFAGSPDFITTPALSLSGTLEVPAEVDVFVDGDLVATERLGPGEFTIDEIRPARGEFDAELVIRDVFGRTRRISQPFRVASRALRPGVSIYRYGLGLRRGFDDRGVTYSSDPVFVGRHRVGLTPALTPGLRVEAGESLISGGIDAALALIGSADGEVGVAASYRNDEAGDVSLGEAIDTTSGRGWAAYAALSGRIADAAYWSANAERRSPTYSTLSSIDSASRLSANATVTARLGRLGGLTFAVRYQESFTQDPTTALQVAWRGNLPGRTFLTVRAAWDDVRDDNEAALFATLRRSFGIGRAVTATVSEREDMRTQSLRARQSRPRGLDASIFADYERSTDGLREPVETANVLAQGGMRYGDWRLRAGKTFDGLGTWSTSWQAALVGFDGRVFAGRPVRDGFLVADTGGVAGIEVLANSARMGISDETGLVLVPEASGYVEQRLRARPPRFQLATVLENDRLRAAVLPRGGQRVRFEARRARAIQAKLVLSDDTPAKLGVVTLDDGSEHVTGASGLLWLETERTGTIQGNFANGAERCAFTLDVVGSTADIAELGEVRCE